MNKTPLVLAAHRGPGKGRGAWGVWERNGSFILEHKLDGSRDLMNAQAYTHIER